MKKKVIFIIAALVVVTMTFLSCGKDDDTVQDDQNKTLSDAVRIYTLAGAGEDALAALPDGFEVEVSKKTADIETQILNNDYDLAVVSVNTAARLSQRSGGDLVVISPMVLNDWFVVSNNGYITSQSISDLRGETIIASGQGGAGEAVLRKLLSDNYINPDYGVRMEWVDTQDQVLEALYERGTVALLQEPFASRALELNVENGEITSDIDLGLLWEEKHRSPIPSDVIIANKQFVKEREDDLQIFIREFEASLAKAKESTDASLVFYGRTNRGMDLVKQYIDFMGVYDINLLGGESPDATFYYGIGE